MKANKSIWKTNENQELVSFDRENDYKGLLSSLEYLGNEKVKRVLMIKIYKNWVETVIMIPIKATPTPRIG